VIRDYIDKRLAAYEKVLADSRDCRPADAVGIALIIWRHRLFFETHEYLEPFWLASGGDEKRMLQALIRAAGTYVHLEQGNRIAARRIAAKAMAAIEKHRQRLALHIDPQLLLDKLRSLDPEPPVSAPVRQHPAC
jgi:hypothetical protein